MSKTAGIEQLLKLKHYNRFTRYRTTTVTKRRAGSLLRPLLPGHQSKEHNQTKFHNTIFSASQNESY